MNWQNEVLLKSNIRRFLVIKPKSQQILLMSSLPILVRHDLILKVSKTGPLLLGNTLLAQCVAQKQRGYN